MSPIEREVVRRKLATIIENLKVLEPITAFSEREYIEDIYKRKATERLLQEMIEAAVDINTHIIVQSGHAVPDEYYESFIRVGELNVIPFDLAQKLAPSAGLSNRLVHEYDMLDHAVILSAVKVAENQYSEYVVAIEHYLATNM